MIRNILFDMGQVLLTFDRQMFLDRLYLTEDEKKLLLREVFLSVEWVQMDRGTLNEPQAEKRMCSRLPEKLHSAVHELVSRWDQPIMPVAGMYELVQELKQKGYGVYLLSNASVRQHEYWPRLPVSELFDGKLISADVGVMKPHPDIYRLCLEKFGLKAEECFFIDDVPANIEGGIHCGIAGAVFHGDVPALRRQLLEAGICVQA
ncbi:MAG: HAD family phosphatase [Oscillospiraceae bacterium]|nr:HAD family phosphatase [Oscillospiraceae bacterium]